MKRTLVFQKITRVPSHVLMAAGIIIAVAAIQMLTVAYQTVQRNAAIEERKAEYRTLKEQDEKTVEQTQQSQRIVQAIAAKLGVTTQP